MMKIEFRAWDKLEKRMGLVNYIKFSNVQYTQISARFKREGKTVDEWFAYGDKNGCDNVILMQCTGLKDKNGKEIYEGDIIKITQHPSISDVAAIEYDETIGAFQLNRSIKLANCGGYDLSIFFLGISKYNFDVEVIGNIYENQELLKGR